jgi:hypothetical protein
MEVRTLRRQRSPGLVSKGFLYTIEVVSEVTRILGSIAQRDPKAAEELLPLVYEELRKLAAHKMANGPPGQTLQSTALVHEAWLRPVGSADVEVTSRPRLLAADQRSAGEGGGAEHAALGRRAGAVPHGDRGDPVPDRAGGPSTRRAGENRWSRCPGEAPISPLKGRGLFLACES